MTDTIETPQAASEAHPFISEHKVGDTISIKMGKNAGKTGEIIARNDEDSTFVIKFPDGKFVVSTQSNARGPESAKVEVRALVAALQGVQDSNATQRLLAALETVVPGIRTQIELGNE